MRARLAALFLLFASVALALPEGMGGHNWMSYLPDDLSIGQVNMPGSHDAEAYNCKAGKEILGKMANVFGKYFNCQKMSISDQFNLGVRNFDLRYIYDSRYNNSSPYGGRDYVVCHGQAHCDTSNDGLILFFNNTVQNLTSCLASNGKEFTIITYQYEGDFDGSYSIYAPSVSSDTAKSYITADIDSLCARDSRFMRVASGSRLPTVGEARGKIIFIHQAHYNSHSSPWNTRLDAKKIQASGYWNQCGLVDFITHYENNDDNIVSSMIRYVTISFCDLDSPIKVVGFKTGYYNESGSATTWIENGGYDFKSRYCYGTVLMNFVTEGACKKVYQSNLFAEDCLGMPALSCSKFNYDGQKHEVSIIYPDSAMASYYEVAGPTEACEVGEYTISLRPKDATRPWKDTHTLETRYLTWEIWPDKIEYPVLDFSTFEFDNQEHVATWTYAGRSMNRICQVQGTDKAVKHGKYSLTFVPEVPWKDSGTKEPYVLEWEIKVTSFVTPTLSNARFEYDGSVRSVSVIPDAKGHESLYAASGTFKGTKPNAYAITVTPNYPWTDTGTMEARILNWEIAVSSVGNPSLSSTTFPYDGAEHAVRVIPPNNDSVLADYYDVSGHLEGRSVGRYDVVVTPKAPWKDGSGMAAKTLSWKITMTGGLEYPKFQSDVLKYTGEAQSPQLVNTDFNSYMSISGQMSATEPGYYVIVYKPIAISWEATGDKREYFLFYRIVK